MEKKNKADIQSVDTSLLEELKAKDLGDLNLAPGDIYWKKNNGKLILLYRAGEFFSKIKIQEFRDQNHKLLYLPLGHREQRLQFEVALGRFLSSEFEEDRQKYRQQLLGLIKTYYWDSLEESSLLDLVLVFDQYFNKWAQQDESFLLSRPDVQKRNALIGTLNVLGGMALSYNHVHYLQDLYNIVYLVDYSYQKTMTPKLFKLLDCEHVSSDEFEKAFQILSEQEQKEFHQHALKDYEQAKNDFLPMFHYSSSFNFLKRHHELVTGKGHPMGVNQEELPDIELWGLIISRLFSWNQLNYENSDGYEAFKNVLGLKFRRNTKAKDYVGRRVSMLISGIMEGLAPLRDVA